jgi:DNA-directed RNA polymerase specialized sigma24 family protein
VSTKKTEFPSELADEITRCASTVARKMGVACPHRVDDMVQESLLKVWRYWLRKGVPGPRLLRRMVRFACVEHLRDLNGRSGLKYRFSDGAFTACDDMHDATEDGTSYFAGPHEDELRDWLLENVTKDSRARDIAERTLDGHRAVDIARDIGVGKAYISIVQSRLRDNYRPKIASGESPFDARLVA